MITELHIFFLILDNQKIDIWLTEKMVNACVLFSNLMLLLSFFRIM